MKESHAFDVFEPFLAVDLFPILGHKREVASSAGESRHRPEGHSADEIRQWLVTTSHSFKISPTQWARTAGLAPSTLNRFIANAEYPKNLSASTLERLSKALREITPDPASSKSFEDLNLFGDSLYSGVKINVIGEIGSATSVRADQPLHSFNFPVLREYSHLRIFGFYIPGSEYSPVYFPGTMLVTTPLFELGRPPSIGERYVFHTRSNDLFTGTIRELSLDPAGRRWLLPVGNDLEQSAGIFLGSEISTPPRSKQHGRATFLVLGSYAQEQSVLRRHLDERAFAEEAAEAQPKS